MMVSSRAKGQRGEREWGGFLREHLACPDAIRGQQHRGGPDAPDVLNGIPGTHSEVKRTEALRLWDALDQAVSDAGEAVPYVAHRPNRRDWIVVVRAADIERFSRAVVEHLGDACT